MNEELKKYYPSLDNYVKLCMTTYGKIKLSVIPEGVSFSVYNYYRNQPKMPSYDDFFKSCIHQCETQKIELDKRFDAFYSLCKKHNIDTHRTATTYIPQIPESETLDVEKEFWKIEQAKLTPTGIASAYKHGYHPNPYRKAMFALKKHEYYDLFSLYVKVHPDKDECIHDYDTHKNYLTGLHNTFSK